MQKSDNGGIVIITTLGVFISYMYTGQLSLFVSLKYCIPKIISGGCKILQEVTVNIEKHIYTCISMKKKLHTVFDVITAHALISAPPSL